MAMKEAEGEVEEVTEEAVEGWVGVAGATRP